MLIILFIYDKLPLGEEYRVLAKPLILYFYIIYNFYFNFILMCYLEYKGTGQYNY